MMKWSVVAKVMRPARFGTPGKRRATRRLVQRILGINSEAHAREVSGYVAQDRTGRHMFGGFGEHEAGMWRTRGEGDASKCDR